MAFRFLLVFVISYCVTSSCGVIEGFFEKVRKFGKNRVKCAKSVRNFAVFGEFWKIKSGEILPSLPKLPRLK